MTYFVPVSPGLADSDSDSDSDPISARPLALAHIQHVNGRLAEMATAPAEEPPVVEPEATADPVNRADVERWVLVGASVLSVSAVAVIAGAISFGHMADWAQLNGEPAWRQPLFPLSVDGLVIAGSVVLLADSLAGRTRDWLAYLLVIFGAAVSIAANVLHGWEHPIAGHVIAAWPPLSLIGSYELLMRLLRRIRRTANETAGTPAAGTDPAGVPVSTTEPSTPTAPSAGTSGKPRNGATVSVPTSGLDGLRATNYDNSQPDDTALLAILADPVSAPRSADGSVSVRTARKVLGCGTDRARRLLTEAGLSRATQKRNGDQ